MIIQQKEALAQLRAKLKQLEEVKPPGELSYYIALLNFAPKKLTCQQNSFNVHGDVYMPIYGCCMRSFKLLYRL